MACICLLQKQYKPLLEDSTRFLVSYLILLSFFPILFWSCVLRADCRFGAVFLCSKLLPKFSAAACWRACFVTGWFLSEVCDVNCMLMSRGISDAEKPHLRRKLLELIREENNQVFCYILFAQSSSYIILFW